MTGQSSWESFKAEGEELFEKIRRIVHEGNVRRVVIKQQGRTVAEFPLTAGVVGAMLAPIVAAIGTLVALLKECSIEVERVERVEPTASADATNSDDTPRSVAM